MNFWANRSILRMPKKYALLYIIVVMISSCTFKRVNKSMDISEIAGKQEELEDFLHHYFDSVEYDRVVSPILLYHVNFINKTNHLTFCKMNIEQCWDTKGSISIQDSPLGGDLITWSKGDINIDVNSYQNTFRIPKYEACELVICGNMTSHQLLDLPEK